MLIGKLSTLLAGRSLHTTAVYQAVDKALLSKLRKKTGFPFINCKKALEKHDNDLKQAEDWLRQEAQKEGWAKASKLQGRPMSQGLIGVLVQNQSAAMVEVNCETDFVARNDIFQTLVQKVAGACLKHGHTSAQSKVVLGKDGLQALRVEGGSSVADLVALAVGSVGENMAVRRAAYLQAPDDLHLGTYVHTAGLPKERDSSCHMGRFGAFLTFSHIPVTPVDKETEAPPSVTSQELGYNLCQHVVGMNSKSVGDAEGDEASANKDDETKLVFQEFLLDTSLTVGEYLEQNGGRVLDFVRFECGEELAEDDNS